MSTIGGRLLDALRLSPLYHLLRPYVQRFELRRWERGGRRGPVPHLFKQGLVREYARRFGRDILVETGTWLGTMPLELSPVFRRIYSIELDVRLFALARRRFRKLDNVTLLHGDSGTLLPFVLKALDGPALFWLDAHDSGGLTARGPRETPIREELQAILSGTAEPVVLIDDAPLFTGSGDYPSIPELQALVRSHAPGLEVAVSDGVIRIEPPPGEG